MAGRGIIGQPTQRRPPKEGDLREFPDPSGRPIPPVQAPAPTSVPDQPPVPTPSPTGGGNAPPPSGAVAALQPGGGGGVGGAPTSQFQVGALSALRSSLGRRIPPISTRVLQGRLF